MKKCYADAMVTALLLTGGVPQVNASNSDYQMSEVVVEGQRDKADAEYAGGFVGIGTNMGVLGRQDYMSTPMQVTSITSKAIENVKTPGSTFIEAATLDSSVRSRGGNAYNDVSIRGYNISPHDFYIDGIPGLMNQSSIPTNFLERIDIISGPATLTNGFSAQGKSPYGAIDLIPKKAKAEPIHKFTETFSGRGHWEEAIDIGQRFGDHKEWGVRFNADYGKGTTQRKNEEMQTGNVFVDVDFNKDRNRANFFYGYIHVNEMAPDLPLNLGSFDVPTPPDGSSNFQYPWAKYAYTTNIMGISWEHDFKDYLTWFVKFGYQDENWYHCFESFYPTLSDNKGNFTSTIEEVPLRYFRKSFVTGLKSDFQTGTVKHNLVFSFDKAWFSGKYGDWSGAYDLPEFHGNIYDNSIEQAVKPNVDKVDWSDATGQITTGFSLLDKVESGKLTALVGWRHQNDKSEGKYDSSANAPSVGLLYKWNSDWAVYGNWVRGITPGQQVSNRYANKGDVLDPAKTTQKELGFKWDHGNIGGTVSYFDVDQQLPIVDPVTNILGYNGHQKSKGIQMNLFGQPTEKLHIMGGIMYDHVKSVGGTYDGKRYHGAPYWNATLALQYDFTDQFSMTSRLVYNAASWADDNNTKKLDPWTRWDLGAKYTWNKEENPLTLSLNVINVLNHKYWYGAGNNSVYLGTPRTAVISLSYDF